MPAQIDLGRDYSMRYYDLYNYMPAQINLGWQNSIDFDNV
jgi:hypothetical protein